MIFHMLKTKVRTIKLSPSLLQLTSLKRSASSDNIAVENISQEISLLSSAYRVNVYQNKYINKFKLFKKKKQNFIHELIPFYAFQVNLNRI